MSDPVSNAEIEDVLSSIRRLVSVDKSSGSRDAEPDRAAPHESKPAHAVSDEATPDATAPAGGARLVLTPSFRVEPEDLQDEGDSEDHGAEPLAEGETQHLTLDQWHAAIDESVEEAGAGMYAGRDQAEAFDAPDDVHENAGQGDDAQLKEWLTAEDDRAAEADIWEESDESSVDLSEEGFGDGSEEDVDFGAAAFVGDDDVAFEYTEAGDDAVQEAPEREVVTSELEARIAEVEAAVAARDDQWEPDGASEDPYAGGRTEPLPWEDHVEPEEPVFVSYAAQDEYSAAAEEDRRGEDAEDDTAVSGEDEAPRETARSGRTATRDASAPRSGDTATVEAQEGEGKWYREDADAVLDEDALRDLVSEIVRQELQGTLGERITRNVRKLVRREIHRAMMGQDLD